jgi:hypothetical protein
VDWSPAALGFVGALIGATVPSILQARVTRRARLEDAYAELAGATSLLLTISIPCSFGTASSDDAWVRFGAARARVLLQEHQEECRAKLAELSAKIKDLYSITVRLDVDSSSDEEKFRKGREHLAKMKAVEESLEIVLDAARARLNDRLTRVGRGITNRR